MSLTQTDGFWHFRAKWTHTIHRNYMQSGFYFDKREADRLTARGVEAARAGYRSEALRLFDQALRLDDDHLEALLWRGGLGEPEESLAFLERALLVDPRSERAVQGVSWARRRLGLPETTQADDSVADEPEVEGPRVDALAMLEGARSLLARLAPAVLIAVLLLALLGVLSMAQAGLGKNDAALLEESDLNTASATLAQPPLGLQPAGAPNQIAPAATATQPSSALPTAPLLVTATMPVTVASFSTVAPVTTVVASATAASTPPTAEITATATSTITALLDQAWKDEDWSTVISLVQESLEATPDVAVMQEKLFSAYFNYGMQLVNEDKPAEAATEFDKALQVFPGDVRAVAALEAAQAKVKPSTAPVVGTKKIEVDIAKQQVTAWENGQVVYRFAASTGKAPYLTRKGNFTILDKMPNAYASSMQWGMPWWMGIYYAGKWEDGFHAMARLGAKQIPMSESVLGTPQTHGCIMMSDKNAKLLYDWAVVGTPVWIH